MSCSFPVPLLQGRLLGRRGTEGVRRAHTIDESTTEARRAALRRRRLHIPPFPFGKESSSIPLLLLSPQDPLRWAPAGDPLFPDLTGKKVRPEDCPTIEKDCRPDGRQSEETILGNISPWTPSRSEASRRPTAPLGRLLGRRGTEGVRRAHVVLVSAMHSVETKRMPPKRVAF